MFVRMVGPTPDLTAECMEKSRLRMPFGAPPPDGRIRAIEPSDSRLQKVSFQSG